MIASPRTFSGFGVDDIDAAREFYRDVLELEVVDDPMGFIWLHLPSGGRVLAYSRPGHVPAEFTILNFPVPDVDDAVSWLNDRGVVTKIYSDPDFGTDERGISRGRGPTIAWFRDPAQNVLAVIQD